MLANLPKKARKAVRKRTQLSGRATHPLHNQIMGLVQPFKATNGVAQHLVDSLPSQKYTLRSRFSAGIPSGGCMAIMLSPYAWSDANFPSGVIFTANSASTAESSGDAIFESAVVGSTNYPTGFTSSGVMIPTRPYTYGAGKTARLVSYGLRVRYTGAGLYASGTFKLLATPHGEMDLEGGTTFNQVVERMNGSHATQMKSIYDRAVYEFNFLGNDEWSENGCGADQDETTHPLRLGKASSTTQFSEPGAFGYYVNSSGNAVTFELELVENWEVRGTSVAPFYTDSHTDPALHHEIVNIVNTAHQRAGLSPSTKFSDVVTSVSKASKSPLGKAVLAAALA